MANLNEATIQKFIVARNALNEAESEVSTAEVDPQLKRDLSNLLDNLDGIIVELEPDAERYDLLSRRTGA